MRDTDSVKKKKKRRKKGKDNHMVCMQIHSTHSNDSKRKTKEKDERAPYDNFVDTIKNCITPISDPFVTPNHFIKKKKKKKFSV